MIGVIINPHARRGLDPELPRRLQRVVADAGAAGQVRIEVTWDLDALRQAAGRFAQGGAEVVAVCGGDGTTMATMTALAAAFPPERLPRLLLLRGGTVNTVARNLQVRGRPEELLRRALRAIRGPGDLSALPLWWQDLVCVRARDGEGEVPPRHGCLFAAAMGARFLETYYALPRQGVLPAALLTGRTVLSTLVPGGGPLARRLFADTEARLWVDGEEAPELRHRLLLAATVPDVGMGMRVTWQAGRASGRLHVVASRLSLFEMARQLPRVLRGEPLRGAPHLDRLARSLRLRFTSPQPYTLDGDLFRATEVDVEVGPRIPVIGPLE